MTMHSMADPFATTRRQHVELAQMGERFVALVDRAFVVVAPTVKLCAAWGVLWLVQTAFGVRVESPRVVAAVAVVLWLWWALRRWNAEPILPAMEAYRLRVKARDADERGFCRDKKCKLCGGKPAPTCGCPFCAVKRGG